MPYTRHNEAPEQQLHGFTFQSLARSEQGATELAVWRILAPPRAASPRHSMSHEEAFVIQHGTLVATLGDEHIELGPGDCLTVPADTPFQLANPFDQPAEAIACTRLGMAATINGQSMTPPWAR
jgi:mannose-6-phosphate isomerase-like protein (cupin superfamily)